LGRTVGTKIGKRGGRSSCPKNYGISNEDQENKFLILEVMQKKGTALGAWKKKKCHMNGSVGRKLAEENGKRKVVFIPGLGGKTLTLLEGSQKRCIRVGGREATKKEKKKKQPQPKEN